MDGPVGSGARAGLVPAFTLFLPQASLPRLRSAVERARSADTPVASRDPGRPSSSEGLFARARETRRRLASDSSAPRVNDREATNDAKRSQPERGAKARRLPMLTPTMASVKTAAWIIHGRSTAPTAGVPQGLDHRLRPMMSTQADRVGNAAMRARCARRPQHRWRRRRRSRAGTTFHNDSPAEAQEGVSVGTGHGSRCQSRQTPTRSMISPAGPGLRPPGTMAVHAPVVGHDVPEGAVGRIPELAVCDDGERQAASSAFGGQLREERVVTPGKLQVRRSTPSRAASGTDDGVRPIFNDACGLCLCGLAVSPRPHLPSGGGAGRRWTQPGRKWRVRQPVVGPEPSSRPRTKHTHRQPN